MADDADQFDALLDDVMALPPEERMAGALAVFRREHARLRALFNHHSWAQGRRGDGVAIIPGLTETLTSLVRRFAACGLVRHDDVDDLARHVSALRKWLAKNAPSVVIATRKVEGYEVVAGFDDLYRMLHTAQAPGASPQRQRAPGFTLHQSAILFHLATHGSAHMEQFPCLPRHISNIRALLAAQGLERSVSIETRVGEGVYVVAKGRDELRRLILGEAAEQVSEAEFTPKTSRATRTQTKWTRGRTELLCRLWADKSRSIESIAAEIGGFDHAEDGGRRAVHEKAHALGLESRQPLSTRRGATPRRRQAGCTNKEAFRSNPDALLNQRGHGSIDTEFDEFQFELALECVA